jgi:hypothetical protein
MRKFLRAEFGKQKAKKQQEIWQKPELDGTEVSNYDAGSYP